MSKKVEQKKVEAQKHIEEEEDELDEKEYNDDESPSDGQTYTAEDFQKAVEAELVNRLKNVKITKSKLNKDVRCPAQIASGGRRGEICNQYVVIGSNYCQRHKNHEKKMENGAKVSGDKCQAKLSTGPKMGQPCSLNVSSKSESGKYCGKHSYLG